MHAKTRIWMPARDAVWSRKALHACANFTCLYTTFHAYTRRCMPMQDFAFPYNTLHFCNKKTCLLMETSSSVAAVAMSCVAEGLAFLCSRRRVFCCKRGHVFGCSRRYAPVAAETVTQDMSCAAGECMSMAQRCRLTEAPGPRLTLDTVQTNIGENYAVQAFGVRGAAQSAPKLLARRSGRSPPG